MVYSYRVPSIVYCLLINAAPTWELKIPDCLLLNKLCNLLYELMTAGGPQEPATDELAIKKAER